VGADGSQPLQRLVGFVRGADQLVVVRQARQSLHVIGIGEKNLLPELDGHVRPASRLKCARLLHQNRAGRLHRPRDRRTLGKAYLERQHQAARNERTLSPSHPVHAHRRFHSTFSSPFGPNLNLPSK